MDADVPKDERHVTYGKAVWSWRPDAGVKLAMMLRIALMMGARKPGPQGERGISRQTTRAGDAGLPPLNLYARVLLV